MMYQSLIVKDIIICLSDGANPQIHSRTVSLLAHGHEAAPVSCPILLLLTHPTMKTLDQIAQNYKSDTLDGRDLHRLAQFIPEDRLSEFGLKLNPEFQGKHEVVEFTRENVLKQLEKDVDFGFEKALNQRGISSGLMYNVVKMWNWILEEGLEDFDDYAQYGLPLFKATAVKYGFENPIGDDYGDEITYAAYDYCD